ncbi:serine esterase (DUF676) [Gloeocapsa sp. PCC 73106]|uniref:alpha/beta hydrolase n=1 Tax=Gloeocapsa sp. PCC 73106 TaxID=102232 RepID=UPI0002ABA268|nr:serine esterase (DUF676) [Gloeocapsa sp. PCC 73106]ELR98518.1 Putative serine esterase (DUF676) [Gloeocapsa sp. PCC 73106]
MSPRNIIFIPGWKWEGSFVPTDCEQTFKILNNNFNNHGPCTFDSYFLNYPTGFLRKRVLINYRFPPQIGERNLIENARLLLNELRDLFFTYVLFCYQNKPDHDRNITSLKEIRKPKNYRKVFPQIQNELKSFKIILIGHSAGGLLIRQAFIESEETNNVDKIIMRQYVVHSTLIASPSVGVNPQNMTLMGVPLGEVFKVIEINNNRYFSQQLKQLIIDSNFLTNLNNKWSNLSPKPIVRCIYAAQDQLGITPIRPYGNCIVDPNFVTIESCNHNSILNQEKAALEVCRHIIQFMTDVQFC